jgi:hypothetical protein
MVKTDSIAAKAIHDKNRSASIKVLAEKDIVKNKN